MQAQVYITFVIQKLHKNID